MEADTLTVERIDDLLRFLPLFDMQRRKFVEDPVADNKTVTDAMHIPYPVYCTDVQEFFRLASQPWWRDREYLGSGAAERIRNDQAIAAATLDGIKSLLTYCVRGERFCDGFWDEMLGSGRIVLLPKRLKEIRASLPNDR